MRRRPLHRRQKEKQQDAAAAENQKQAATAAAATNVSRHEGFWMSPLLSGSLGTWMSKFSLSVSHIG